MAGDDIWFDGVSKKLLEAHSTEKKSLVEGDDRTLMTKTPLASFASLKRRKPREKCDTGQISESDGSKANNKKKSRLMNGNVVTRNDTIKPNTGITEEVAMDCEMVECFHHRSVLARVSIVNLFGHPILDRYVAPPSKVTDYRTRFSGIRRKDLENAPDFDTVQKEVADIIRNRIVVGHAVHHDFAVLKLSHPPEMVRDTSSYYKHLFQGKTPSLKKLSESLLGLKIQKGEHDSVQDAQATMKLYVKERDKWNEKLIKFTPGHPTRHSNQKQKKKPQKKKTKTFYVLTT